MTDTLIWQNLIDWLQHSGMKTDSESLLVRLCHFQGIGRGLAVTKTVTPLTKLFNIPRNCLLNRDTLSKWTATSSANHLSSIQILSLYLALHRSRETEIENKSFFAAYIATLPNDFKFHPLSWLMDPSLKAQGLVNALPQSIKRRLSEIENRCMADISAIQTTVSDISWNDILWAWLNVNTRSLYYKCLTATTHEDNITMCPLLDFANHSCDAPNLNSSQFRKAGYPIPTMVSPPEYTICEGDQVFLRYGLHANEVLFTEYGFTIATPDESIAVDHVLERLFEQSKGFIRKKTLLETHGYWLEWTIHADSEHGYPSYRVIPALWLLHTDLDDAITLEHWEQAVAGIRDEVSAQITLAAKTTLLNICVELTSEYSEWLSRKAELGNLAWEQEAQRNIEGLWHTQMSVCKHVVAALEAGEGWQ